MKSCRQLMWCVLLNLTLEDLDKKISISELVSNAEKSLINQVNCDVDRCSLEDYNLKNQLKKLILSIFTYQKSRISYIQGVHDIGSVFLMLFVVNSNETKEIDIDSIIFELKFKEHHLENLKERIDLIQKKLNCEDGRMDLCFKTFEKFLLKYLTPFIYKNNFGTNTSLDEILVCISEDLLYLLSKSSSKLCTLFKNIGLKDDPQSKIFMFALPWLITWFSHNISLEKADLLFYLYDNFVKNEPLYIVFFIEEILIQNHEKLMDFLKIQLNSHFILESAANHDIYPFVHLYFQNLEISNFLWEKIIENSCKSYNKTCEKFLKSRSLWDIKNYNSDNSSNSKFYSKISFSKNYNKTLFLSVIFTFSGILIAYLFNSILHSIR